MTGSRVVRLTALVVGLHASTALAHVGLVQPVSRYGINVLKAPPCGLAGGQRSTNVYTFQPGETITVVWDEYINHPGHFRIAFDADGDDDFVDPECLADCDTTNPTVQMYNNAAVLLDDIADTLGGQTTISVTLPDVECTNCTLQVIQVMYDKPPYTIPGNEMYYQCVDLVLTRGAPPVDAGVEPDAGARPDAGPPRDAGGPIDAGPRPMPGDVRGDIAGGCRCVAGTSQSPGALVGLVFLSFAARRARVRRRRRG